MEILGLSLLLIQEEKMIQHKNLRQEEIFELLNQGYCINFVMRHFFSWMNCSIKILAIPACRELSLEHRQMIHTVLCEEMDDCVSIVNGSNQIEPRKQALVSLLISMGLPTDTVNKILSVFESTVADAATRTMQYVDQSEILFGSLEERGASRREVLASTQDRTAQTLQACGFDAMAIECSEYYRERRITNDGTSIPSSFLRELCLTDSEFPAEYPEYIEMYTANPEGMTRDMYLEYMKKYHNRPFPRAESFVKMVKRSDAFEKFDDMYTGGDYRVTATHQKVFEAWVGRYWKVDSLDGYMHVHHDHPIENGKPWYVAYHPDKKDHLFGKLEGLDG